MHAICALWCNVVYGWLGAGNKQTLTRRPTEAQANTNMFIYKKNPPLHWPGTIEYENRSNMLERLLFVLYMYMEIGNARLWRTSSLRIGNAVNHLLTSAHTQLFFLMQASSLGKSSSIMSRNFSMKGEGGGRCLGYPQTFFCPKSTSFLCPKSSFYALLNS